MKQYSIVRLLRTPSSERFMLQCDGNDSGALDVHFVPDGTVQATLVVFDETQVDDTEISFLLSWIDEVLLPQATLASEKLFFTVVKGHVVGSFTPTQGGSAHDPATAQT